MHQVTMVPRQLVDINQSLTVPQSSVYAMEKSVKQRNSRKYWKVYHQRPFCFAWCWRDKLSCYHFTSI